MKHIEPLTGGVVNTKDGDTLSAGELQQATDWLYLSNVDNIVHGPSLSPTLIRANPYIVYGLAAVTFDNAANYLIAQYEDKFQYAGITPANGTLGAWADLTTHTTATARNGFSAVHYNNKYYIFDGVGDNKVLRQDVTTRRHGLLPVINAPTITSATAVGDYWPVQATGYFHYWFTEAMELSGDPEDIIVESAYAATAAVLTTSGGGSQTGNVAHLPLTSDKILVGSVLVTGLNTTVSIELPSSPRNTEATHYYVYRGGPTEFISDTAFPIGEMVARKDVNDTAPINDGTNSTTSSEFYPQAFVDSDVHVFGGGTLTWTTASNAASINSTTYSNLTYAILNTTATVSGSLLGNVDVGSFSITGVNAPVTRISVTARVRSGSAPSGGHSTNAWAALSFDGGVSFTGGRNLSNAGALTLQTTPADYTTGYVNWGRALTLDDISNSNLRVRIVLGGSHIGSGTVGQIDGVKITVEGSTTEGVAPVPYPGIVLRSGQIEYVTSRNGQPPIAKTGCIFQGSLVTDDAEVKSNLRWSIPGDPEAFPALYYLPIETENNDAITYIGTVNNVCIVGLQNAIARINMLPSEDDASFNRTRIYDFISTKLGILHHRAACTFLTPGGRELLAMMTQDGIYVTDGYTINKWDGDYDSIIYILKSLTDQSIPLYNPKYLQMCNDVSSGNIFITWQSTGSVSKTLPINYSPRHLKEGPRFKIGGTLTGPAAFNGCGNASVVTTSGVPVVYFINNPLVGGGAYLSTLAQIGAGGYTGMSTTPPNLLTRRFMFNDGSEEASLNEIYLYSSGVGINGITVQAVTTLVDETGTHSSPTTAFVGGRVSKVDMLFEGMQTYLSITATTADIHKLNRIMIDYTKFGQKGIQGE